MSFSLPKSFLNLTLKPGDFDFNRGFSSVGRASDLHSEGQEFESPSLQSLHAVIAQLVRARH